MRTDLLPRLREDDEVLVVETGWLVEEIRQGRLPPEAEVQFGPWTGDDFRPASRIPALAGAWDAPHARLTAWLLRRQRAWLALGVTAVMLGFGLLQTASHRLPASLATALALLPRAWGTGFEAILLDDAVASPWTSLWVHAGRDHLLLNLAVVGYSGFRVERALGRMGWALVGAAAVLSGAAFVAVGDDLPVIGSSTLAFGLWGAQLVLGFRFGAHLPERLQRYYGYGNLPVFGVLATATALADGVSQWGHLGGVLGGALAAAMAPPPPWAGRGRTPALLALLTATALLGPALRAAPTLAWGAPRAVQLRSGLSLEIPARLLPERWERHGEGAPWAHTLLGLPAWTTPNAATEAMFCGVVRLDRDTDPAELLARWPDQLGGAAHLWPAPAPIGPGWSAHALELRTDQGRWLLVEHQRQHGRWLARAGRLTRLDRQGDPGRRAALFDRALRTVELGAPPSVERARQETRRTPTSARAWLDLAAVLEDAGRLDDADVAYQRALALEDPLAVEAAARRLDLWAAAPMAFPPSGEPWFEPWLADWPDATSMQLDALWWLVAHGECAQASRTRDEVLSWPAREQANAAVASCETPAVARPDDSSL